MIYFFYGEDAFRSGEKATQLKSKFLDKNPSASGLKTFIFEEKAKEDGAHLIVRAIGEKNLFSSKQLIVVRNFLKYCSRGSSDQLLSFLKERKGLIEDQETFLLFWEEFRPTSSNKLFQFLRDNAKKEEFPRLSGFPLTKWIEKRLLEIDSTSRISKTALEKLVAYVGSNTLKLRNEIEKLAAYKNGEEISEADVDSLVKAETSETIFAMTDAVSSGDKKKALGLIESQLEKGADPHQLFFMSLSQFRNLLKVSEFYFQNQKNYSEIAKSTKLHPFVVQKALRQLGRYTPESLQKTYQLFQELDLKMKTGRMEACLALDILVMKI